MASQETKKVLTNYLRKLTNLSGRNRSIFLPRLSSEQFIDIQQLSQLNGEKAFGIIESLIAGKKKKIGAVLDPRMQQTNEASGKLKKLQRADRFIFDERGAKELHVGWPFVKGKFLDGTMVRCPLLYFPVELKIENEYWVLALREGAEVGFNKSFLLAYSFYNKVKADETLLEETFEDAASDSTVFRTQLYQLLQAANIAIHFNPDNYRDELISFQSYKKEEFEEQYHTGALKLFPEAVLGIFPQAGSSLVPDYQHLIESDSFTDLEDFFYARSPIKSAVLSDSAKQVREEKVYSIFPMDGLQEKALKATKLGNSIVVQGPPGTGKSQLICNLISDSIAQGKKVLVVCQKRAALDVVYERLQGKSATDFVVLVHDFKNDRNIIYNKIAKQIERVDEYKSRNNSIDAIQLDRQFFQLGKRIDQLTEELDSFHAALYSDSDCGLNAKQLYLLSDPSKSSVNLKQECNEFKLAEILEFSRKLKSYCFYAEQFEAPAYEWRERKSFSSLAANDRLAMAEAINELPIYFNQVKENFELHFKTKLDWEQCEALIDKRLDAITIKELVADDNRYSYFQKMMPEPEDETSALWLANMERVIMECYDGNGVEKSIPSNQLGQLQTALHRSMKSRRSLIAMIGWELFSKDKYLIKRALVANKLDTTKAGFLILEKLLDQRLNLEHNLSKLKAANWLLQIPDGLTKSQTAAWFADQQSAIKAKNVFCSIRGIKNLISPIGHSKKEFVADLDKLFELLSQLPGKKDQWLTYLLSSQIASITQVDRKSNMMHEVLLRDFDLLVEYDSLKDSLSKQENAILKNIEDKIEDWRYEKVNELFENSIYLAWIEYLEAKYPQLRMASSGKLTLIEQELKELIIQKQSISVDLLLLRSREQVTEGLEFNRLNNRVTYRDLLHQVTKKKKIWPLRKVVTDFEEEMFRLLPCWLASPESVSAIFPMKEIFDLVIFDEASQCYAERGIPALFRGKQAVVAGDSMQLRPGDFYQTRWQEELEEPDAEVDSLLELSNRYLASIQLQGHYRSKSLELIEFSNHHFYQGKLRMLPDWEIANRSKPAIDYLKVDGLWGNNANEIEADRVVAELIKIWTDTPDANIGVITFNAPQQSLILDKLEENASVYGKQIPTSLFVKNIENVQGDERDIIIFSVGYAPDKTGVVNTQFGSLSMSGGENRLNVAVTRAREKIIIVTSLLPDQLRVDDAKNEGPKLLKQYLQFSLTVSEGKFRPLAQGENQTGFLLKSKVIEWGAQHDAQIESDVLPFFDLTVKKNNTLIGGILTDDDLYYSSASSKSTHALVPQVLEEKRWPYLQVYSRNYWLDKERFFNEIGKFLMS